MRHMVTDYTMLDKFNRYVSHVSDDPRLPEDVCNKNYVDHALKNVVVFEDKYLDVQNKRLVNVATPMIESDGVTKYYVDNIIYYVNEMHADLGDKRLSSVLPPEEPLDAVNMEYVDTRLHPFILHLTGTKHVNNEGKRYYKLNETQSEEFIIPLDGEITFLILYPQIAQVILNNTKISIFEPIKVYKGNIMKFEIDDIGTPPFSCQVVYSTCLRKP